MKDKERVLKEKIKRNKIGLLITAFLLISIAFIILILGIKLF
jgi:hypothetical protein